MGELVDGLQRLSRATTAPLVRQPLDLSALALEVLDGLRVRDPARACQWSVQPALVAQGDRALVRQLLENLLGNAWKYSAGQALTRIAVGREPGPRGAFYVRDHGAGFDMAQAERLFQPFERLHSASEFPGTGIGLYTVRRIAQRHGGQVRAQASPGAGAHFFFTLA
jgi:signal transduction histidine kinase